MGQGNPPSARALVIGYGNPLRSDDALGPHAVRALCATLPPGHTVDCLEVHQLTPELCDRLAAVDRVLFIDASAEGPAGTLRFAAISSAAPGATAPLPTYLSPADLLDLTHALHGRRPAAHVLSITGASFAFGEVFSPAVSARIPELLTRARAWSEAS